MTKNTNKRYGFHSIESIINNNPHTIKKLFIPSSRDDKRIHQLISLAEKFEIKYEISNMNYKTENNTWKMTYKNNKYDFR